MTLARAQIHVSGRVQGVYFRRDSGREALKLGLNGWVRNLTDRRVEAIVEGEESQIEDFIDWCRRGPPLAMVRDIAVEWQPYTGSFSKFEIRY
jgi:acylphosphatase